MKSYKNILLGLVIGAFLVLLMGATLTYHTNESKYFDDDCDVFFGTTLDFSIYCDTATILEFDPLVAGNEIRFGTAHTDAVDLTWYGDTDGDTVTFDEENCEVLFADIDIQLDDAAKLIFGTGDDVTVYSDTADTLTFDPGAAGDTFEVGTAHTDAFDVKWYSDTEGRIFELDEESVVANFGADANGLDAKFFADTTGDYILWDASDEALEFVGTNITLDADSILTLGQIVNADVVVTTGTYVVLVANSGKVHVIPDLAGATTINLPVEADGLYYKFIYCGVAEAHTHTIDSGSNTNYFIGGVAFIDEDAGAGADELSIVVSDGNSNSKLALVNLESGSYVELHCDGVKWYVSGTIYADTTPTVADQS